MVLLDPGVDQAALLQGGESQVGEGRPGVSGGAGGGGGGGLASPGSLTHPGRGGDTRSGVDNGVLQLQTDITPPPPPPSLPWRER